MYVRTCLYLQAVDGAHAQSRQSNSITSLALTRSVPLLVSACKSGVLKLWTCDTCQNIGLFSSISQIKCSSVWEEEQRRGGGREKEGEREREGGKEEGRKQEGGRKEERGGREKNIEYKD